MDQDQNALYRLAADAREHCLANTEIVHDSWPVSTPIQADVVVALHVYQVMRSFENLKLVFDSANKGGFIARHASYTRNDEPFCELKEELGIVPEYKMCDNGCYIRGVMETLGARVTCEKAIYEFGQPLDTLEEAVRFICWQIRAEDSMEPAVQKYVDLHIRKSDGEYLVPIQRQSCGITFLK